MYMTFDDLRTKLLNDATFARQLVEDIQMLYDDDKLRFTLNILDDSGLAADESKVNANPNLLNSYINFLNVLGQNQPTGGAEAEPPYNRISMYLRIPFNEPQFNINTNTRIISVPGAFSGNGIGVVGDHLAEILFFKTPRFFDAMDLYLCEIRIVWQDINGEQHIYHPIAIDPEGDELTFGWVITKDVTAHPGSIQFAIEFVHRDSVSTDVDFRLNTQAAYLNVQQGLVVQNEDEIEVENQEEIVYSRAIYSNIINLLSAEPASIIKNLDPSKNMLGEDGTITLDVDAVSTDYENRITYEWMWNNTMIDQPTADAINRDGTYELIEDKNITFADPAALDSEGNPKPDSTYKKITTNVPGSYVVYVGNETPSGSKRYIFTDTVTIPAAGDFGITEINMPPVAYFRENGAKLQIETYNQNGTITYDWYHEGDLIVHNDTTGICDLSLANSEVLNGMTDYSAWRGNWSVVATNSLNNSKKSIAAPNSVFMEVVPTKLRKDFDATCEQLINESGMREDIYLLTLKNIPYAGAQYRYYVEVSAAGGVNDDGTISQESKRVVGVTDYTVTEPSANNTATITINLTGMDDLTVPAGTAYTVHVYVLRGTRLGERDYERTPRDNNGYADYTEFIIEGGAYKSPNRPAIRSVASVEGLQNVASVGGIAVLTDTLTLDEPVEIGGNTTIRLNGQNVIGASNSPMFSVVGGGTLTLTGNGNVSNTKTIAEAVDGGKIVVESGTYASDRNFVFDARGTGSEVVINGGTISGQEGAALAFDGGKVTVENGTLSGVDNFVVATNGTSGRGGNTLIINGGELVGNIQSNGYEACGIYVANSDTLIVNGGTIRANGGSGIVMRAGNVTINGGTITGTGAAGTSGWVGDNKNVLSCSGIVYDAKANYPGKADGISLTINGGTITGVDHSIEVLLGENESANITVAPEAILTPAFPEE